MPIEYVTIDEHAGQRLDNFLIQRLKGVPKSRIYRMVRKGEVRVNGSRSRVYQRLLKGDSIRLPPVRRAAPKTPTVSPWLLETIGAAIAHEDENVLVLDKPADVAVHGGSGIDAGVIETLQCLRPNTFLELVHRLDRGTSGCLVLAKSRATLLELQSCFRDRRVEKEYLAIVVGAWNPAVTDVELPLAKYTLPNGEVRMRVDPSGMPASTSFKVLDQTSSASLVRIKPQTGRTHQIRVHAASQGHSVVGDSKYEARPRTLNASRLMLHAESLVFRDATTAVSTSYEVKPNDVFEDYWTRLKRVD